MFTLICSILFLWAVVFYLTRVYKKTDTRRSVPVFREDYKEFSSSDSLAKIWQEPKNNAQVCKDCGMDDMPLTPIFTVWGQILVCKWCAELREIRDHIYRNEISKPKIKHGLIWKFSKALESIFMAFGDLVRAIIR